jgi:hypothetical protein
MQHPKSARACAEALIFQIFVASPPNEVGFGRPYLFKNATLPNRPKKNLVRRPILPSLRVNIEGNACFWREFAASLPSLREHTALRNGRLGNLAKPARRWTTIYRHPSRLAAPVQSDEAYLAADTPKSPLMLRHTEWIWLAGFPDGSLWMFTSSRTKVGPWMR